MKSDLQVYFCNIKTVGIFESSESNDNEVELEALLRIEQEKCHTEQSHVRTPCTEQWQIPMRNTGTRQTKLQWGFAENRTGMFEKAANRSGCKKYAECTVRVKVPALLARQSLERAHCEQIRQSQHIYKLNERFREYYDITSRKSRLWEITDLKGNQLKCHAVDNIFQSRQPLHPKHEIRKVARSSTRSAKAQCKTTTQSITKFFPVKHK